MKSAIAIAVALFATTAFAAEPAKKSEAAKPAAKAEDKKAETAKK